MVIDFNFSEGPDDEEGKKAEAEREKRVLRILQRFSELSPDLQEEVIKFADSLEGQREENNGQGPAQ